MEETRNELNSESSSEDIVVGSGGSIEESSEDCCDGVTKSKENKSDSSVEVTNEEN